MQDLAERIPDTEQFLVLESEELGAKLLFVLRQRIKKGGKSVHLGNFLNDMTVTGNRKRVSDIWSVEKFEKSEEEIKVAICEAWAWLEAQGMLIPSPDINGQHSFRILSRRAHQYEPPFHSEVQHMMGYGHVFLDA